MGQRRKWSLSAPALTPEKVLAANRLCGTSESSILEVIYDAGTRLGLPNAGPTWCWLQGPDLDLLLEDPEAPPPVRVNVLAQSGLVREPRSL